MTPRTPFQTRLDWALVAAAAAAVAVGMVVSAVRGTTVVRFAAAAAVTCAWVAALQLVPGERQRVSFVGEALAVAGAFAALMAVSITGGGDSPYLLFSLVPTVFAASLLGRRVGVEVAALSTLGLVLVAALRDDHLLGGAVLVAGGVQLVVAFGIAEGVRHVEAVRAASAEAGRAQAAAEAELERLQSAHDLLLGLSLVADAAELSPVQAGQATIENLAGVVDFESCLVALAGDDGPVVVARHGTEIHQHHRTTWPLTVSAREVGFVALSRGADYSDAERTAVAQALRPLALAFSNIIMLRDLAQRAVLEERSRLARALHDDIGPSLASVGLGLDLALMQFPLDEAVSRHLEALRSSVSGLVEEIRSAVSDLRYETRASLVQHVRAVIADAGAGGPQVVIELDERRPPRPSIAADLAALVTEALRNAVRHSRAARVTVEGFVDHGAGSVVVRDDGIGFDPGAVSGRHYGLIGMAERAEAAELTLKVDSSPGAGTAVSIGWGTP